MSTRRLLREWLPVVGLLASLPPLYLWACAVHAVRVWADEPIVEPLTFRIGGHQTVVSGLEPGPHLVLIFGVNQHDTQLDVFAGSPGQPQKEVTSCGYESRNFPTSNYDVWLRASGGESQCQQDMGRNKWARLVQGVDLAMSHFRGAARRP